jgi:hypothetical protein
VSSIEPNNAGDEVDCGQEVSCSLVIAHGDRTELLDLGEEILDQVACPLEVTIKFSRCRSVGLWRDHRGFAGRCQRFDDPLIGIEGFVTDQRVGLHIRQQVVGTNQIVSLAAGQMEADRIAECIDQGMDLGAQSAARAPDGLVFAVFF